MITEKPQYILSSYRNPPRGCRIISRRFLTLESSEKFRAAGENQTHDPPSSSSDALATELLDALWRAGSKFNYNYTSHERDEDSCLIIECRSMGRPRLPSPPPKEFLTGTFYLVSGHALHAAPRLKVFISVR